MKTIKVINMKKKKIEHALANDGNFLSFLGEAARSDEYRRLKETQTKARKVHPAREMLYDYVLGWLNEADTVKVRKHISFCGECADEVLKIMQIEDDLEEESVKWVSEPEEDEREEDDVETVATAVTVAPELSVSVSKIAANLIIWTSKVWEPKWAGQLVTASDIPQQEKTFMLNYGQIKFSCHWKPSYENIPAYIQLSWRAKISIRCELWARFVNPETHKMLSEIRLGTSFEGKNIFTSDKLGFDPSTERWSVSLILSKVSR